MIDFWTRMELLCADGWRGWDLRYWLDCGFAAARPPLITSLDRRDWLAGLRRWRPA